ncbi:MAG: hypothetical protein WBB28_15040 [Crinalium sp.]
MSHSLLPCVHMSVVLKHSSQRLNSDRIQPSAVSRQLLKISP